MSWQLLTTLSVLGLSTSVILQRILLHKDKTDPYAYVVVFQALVGILLMGFALAYGFQLPGIQNLVVPALLSIVCFGAGHILYAKTLQRVEASAFSVLFATQAVWIMLLGIFLFHESLTLLQIAGSLLIFSAVGLLIKNIRALKIDGGTALGLCTGLLFGVAITAWSYVGRHTDGLSWAAISFVGTAIVALAIHPQSLHAVKPLLGGRPLPKLILLSALYGGGSLAMLFAYKAGTFSIVTPLRQTGIIVTTLLALLFLSQERNRIGRKLVAALVCFAGILMIVL